MTIDQLDRLGIERHQMPRRRHRGPEGRELADADDFPRLDRCQGKLHRGREGERALRADQKAGEIVAARRVRRRRQRVDVVAADAAKLAREAGGDLVRLGPAECPEGLQQVGDARRDVLAEIARHHAEFVPRAVGENRIDRADVVGHQAVADRLGPAGVVPRHAADRAACVGRGIDREEQPVRAQRTVQVGQHDPRLDPCGACGRIDLEHAPQVLAAIDHQRAVDRLAALAGAAAAGEDRHAMRARDREGRLHVVDPTRDDHAERHHLVDRGVGRVAAAVGGGEQHLRPGLVPQRGHEGRGVNVGVHRSR